MFEIPFPTGSNPNRKPGFPAVAKPCRCENPLVDSADERGHCFRCGHDAPTEIARTFEQQAYLTFTSTTRHAQVA